MEANYYCEYICEDFKKCDIIKNDLVHTEKQLLLDLDFDYKIIKKLEKEMKILKFEQLFKHKKGSGHDPTPLHDEAL